MSRINEYHLSRLLEQQFALNQSFDRLSNKLQPYFEGLQFNRMPVDLKDYLDMLENIKTTFSHALPQNERPERDRRFTYFNLQEIVKNLYFIGKFNVDNVNIPDSLRVDAKDLNMIYRVADMLSVTGSIISEIIVCAKNFIRLAIRIHKIYLKGLNEAQYGDSWSPFQTFILENSPRDEITGRVFWFEEINRSMARP